VDGNDDHRAKMERLRRWEADQRRAQQTQGLQREAAQRKRRKAHRGLIVGRIGTVLIAAGVLVALTHMLRHLAYNPRGLEDVTAGYPAAAALVVVGLIMLGRR